MTSLTSALARGGKNIEPHMGKWQSETREEKTMMVMPRLRIASGTGTC